MTYMCMLNTSVFVLMSLWKQTRLLVVTEHHQQMSAWLFDLFILRVAGVHARGFSPAGVSQDHRLWPGRRPDRRLPPYHPYQWRHQVLHIAAKNLQSSRRRFFTLHSRLHNQSWTMYGCTVFKCLPGQQLHTPTAYVLLSFLLLDLSPSAVWTHSHTHANMSQEH